MYVTSLLSMRVLPFAGLMQVYKPTVV